MKSIDFNSMVKGISPIVISGVFLLFFPLLAQGLDVPLISTQESTINLPRTGQTISYYQGDDGDLQVGAPWPSPRFTDHGDGTITDNLTGLMWTKDANLPGERRTWREALDYVAGMNVGTNSNFGYTDWCLPNISELESLVNAGEQDLAKWLSGKGFANVQVDNYCSSTAYADLSGSAMGVYMVSGDIAVLEVALCGQFVQDS